MAWNQVRGIARRCAAILGATLLVATLAPLPMSAAQTGLATGGHRLAQKVVSTTGHVDATAASRLPRRIVPASRQLPARPRPARIAGAAIKSGRSARTASPSVVAIPPLSITHVTRTQGQHDVDLQPPDPWVVANASYVISTSNGQARVMNRDNVTLATIPTYALFATDQFHYDSDPRILWDAAHARWIGVVVTYDDPTYADTSLTLAVSDSANPLGTWTTHRFAYGAVLPDYPGISSSSDKVVLTSNLYGNLATDPLGTPEGTAVLAASWSSLLAGSTVAGFRYTYPADDFGLRPARDAGAPEADVPLIFENATSGDLTYVRLTGAASSATLTGETDLGIPNGPALDNAPRQPGGTIGDAANNPVDSRIPDVAYRGDSLYFARTSQYKWDGVNTDLVVEEFVVSISSLATTPVVHVNRWGNVGEDYWMPGIGITSGGGFLLSYTRSSPTVAPEAWAAGSLDGVTYTDASMIAGSTAAYADDRWGDFMAITPDPGGTMSAWAATEVANSDGSWQEVIGRLVLDNIAPSAPSTPNETLVAGSTLGAKTLPIRVSWAAARDPESSVQRYALQDEYDLVITQGTSVTRSHPFARYGWGPNVRDDWQVGAYDDGGNSTFSAWSATLSPIVFEQSLSYTKYSSGWYTARSTAYSGGSAKYSTRSGAYASFRMSGRNFAWVSYKSSTRGKAKVYVDGVYRATITLKSSTSKARNLVYAINYGARGTHTIKVVVVSGRVDVDAFVVLR